VGLKSGTEWKEFCAVESGNEELSGGFMVVGNIDRGVGFDP